jgi:hypothetical protein
VAGNIALGFEGGTSRSASRVVISMRDNCIMYCNRRNRQTSWQCSVPAFSHFLRALKLIRTH